MSAQTFRSGSGAIYPPTNPESVLVFYAEEDVKRFYEVIGEITTAGSTGWGKGEGDLVKKACKKAAEMGASAILLRGYEKGSSGDHAMAVLFGSKDKSAHVTAIRFTESKGGPAPTAAGGGSPAGASTPSAAPPQPAPAPPTLTAPSFRVRVLTDPVGADVYIGDLGVGSTTREGLLLELPAGSVTISVRKLGYSSVERTLTVGSNNEVVLPIALHASPQQ